jgi:hypothetical protein
MRTNRAASVDEQHGLRTRFGGPIPFPDLATGSSEIFRQRTGLPIRLVAVRALAQMPSSHSTARGN